MGIGNDNTYGNKGQTNYNWQYRVLMLLDQIQQAVVASGGGTGNNTPVGPLTITSAGSIPAGSRAFSAINIGDAPGSINGQNLPKNVPVNFSADNGKVFPAVPYDGSGTTIIITYIV